MQATRGTPLSTAGTRRGIGLFLLIAPLVFAVDQATKIWAVARLEDEPAIVIVPNVLSLTFLRNAGAAFGFATGWTLVLSVLAVLVSAYVVWTARRLDDRLWGLALGLLLAGATGNLADRIFREPGPMRGHVVDFLQFTFIDFPVFNVADTALTFGAALIILQTLRGIGIDGRPQNESESGPADD